MTDLHLPLQDFRRDTTSSMPPWYGADPPSYNQAVMPAIAGIGVNPFNTSSNNLGSNGMLGPGSLANAQSARGSNGSHSSTHRNFSVQVAYANQNGGEHGPAVHASSANSSRHLSHSANYRTPTQGRNISGLVDASVPLIGPRDSPSRWTMASNMDSRSATSTACSNGDNVSASTAPTSIAGSTETLPVLSRPAAGINRHAISSSEQQQNRPSNRHATGTRNRPERPYTQSAPTTPNPNTGTW